MSLDGSIIQVLRPKITVPQGLIGYWPLDLADLNWGGNIAYDRSGKNNHGTLSSVTSSALTRGKVRQGLTFGGGNKITTAITPSSIGWSATASTMMVWMRPTGAGASSGQPWLTAAAIADAGGYWGLHQFSAGGVDDRIWAYNWDGGSKTVGVTYTVGEWIHVAWRISGGNLYIFKNGRSGGSVASAATQSIGGTFTIGQHSFAGDLDEVRTYGRVVPDQEILSIYEAGRSGQT